MTNAIYMKHLGIPLQSLRMRYEIDRENGRVHVVSDGFDSVLMTAFCRQIEQQEDVHLIDRTIKNGPCANIKMTIEIWNQRFVVELAEVYAPKGQDSAIAVALRPALPEVRDRKPGAMAGKITIIDDDESS